MGKLYLVDIDNTLLDCLSGLEQVYPGYSKEQQLTYEFHIDGVSAKAHPAIDTTVPTRKDAAIPIAGIVFLLNIDEFLLFIGGFLHPKITLF